MCLCNLISRSSPPKAAITSGKTSGYRRKARHQEEPSIHLTKICQVQRKMWLPFLKASRGFDHTCQLTRDDVTMYPSHLIINHKWSKSHQSSSHPAATKIPAIPGSQLCPKEVLMEMVWQVPTQYPSQPLLMFKDGNHVPLPYIRKVWNSVVTAIKLPRHQKYTLHGLRRGAATHVINLDLSAAQHTKQHGLWKSRAIELYLPKNCSRVFHAMKETIILIL